MKRNVILTLVSFLPPSLVEELSITKLLLTFNMAPRQLAVVVLGEIIFFLT